MKHVEDAFGVSLFKRGKNRLELNKTGQKAIIYARQILDAEKNAIQAVKEFDQHLHSITIVSCAPAPLWEFLPKISANYPEYSIISRICSLSAVVSSLCQGDASIGILPSDYIKKKSGRFLPVSKHKNNSSAFFRWQYHLLCCYR